jgi:hypothetical protein
MLPAIQGVNMQAPSTPTPATSTSATSPKGPRTARQRAATIAALAIAGGALSASVTGGAQAADHLDAPGLTSPSARPDADINDVYVFNSAAPGQTVLVMTTGPGAGAIAPLTYATDVRYKVNVDTNGDAVEDMAYVYSFDASKKNGKSNLPRQKFTVTRYTGAGAQSLTGGSKVASGMTNEPPGKVKNGGVAWAGLRSDPFFFDLDAFRQVVLQQDRGRKGFCDTNGAGVDFFAKLNTNAIILDLPNTQLGGKIGVWSQTLDASGKPIDQMGRPAINAVFNGGADKDVFNATPPSQQLAKFGPNVSKTLATFSGLDKEGAFSPEINAALTGVLIPDVITFDTSTKAVGPLNGRALGDDVIDAELNIVTGGFESPGRDGVGAIPSDCVPAHTDISAKFPYLGKPHSA